MRTITILMFAFGVGLARGEDDKVIKEMAAFDGQWKLIYAVVDGKELPEELLKSGKRTAKGDESTVEVSGKLVMRAKFTIDPAAKVKAIDYTFLEGPNKDKSALGIYEFDGETLKFCLSAPEAERPTRFESKAGSKHAYSIWRKSSK